MAYTSISEILNCCEKEHCAFYEAVLLDDLHERDTTRAESFRKIKQVWENMLDAGARYDPGLRSASGMVGQDGGKMEDYVQKGLSLSGGFMGSVIAGALQMGESNACMKRIVAAPTAGACGVLPAVLIPYYKQYQPDEQIILQGLYIAAGIGQVIAARAFIAGACGGCQAEVGTASAMAAAAMTGIRGGAPEQIADACAMALKNLLGLVCDPVAGLVEVPCIKRNVIGAVNAISCADMALAGIKSAIPADEVIDAMREIGDKMDPAFKETSLGGLAATPQAMRYKNQP